ncbi:hypothetical protein HKD37_13G036859 [Glycine soja]
MSEAWKFSQNGVYSFCTAYHPIMDKILKTDQLKVHAKYTSKIKHFLWRALRGYLPTRQSLTLKAKEYWKNVKVWHLIEYKIDLVEENSELQPTIAAIFREQKSFGVSMCLRDDQGSFINARIPLTHEAEAYAFHQSVIWVRNLQLQNYCKMIHAHLASGGRKGTSNFHTIIYEFSPKQANLVPHKLARAIRFDADIHNYDYIPAFILLIILDEMK